MCGNCGARQNAKHAMCSECGKDLAGAIPVMKNHAYTCLGCGKDLDKGEKFCPGCGKENPGYLPRGGRADSRDQAGSREGCQAEEAEGAREACPSRRASRSAGTRRPRSARTRTPTTARTPMTPMAARPGSAARVTKGAVKAKKGKGRRRARPRAPG